MGIQVDAARTHLIREGVMEGRVFENEPADLQPAIHAGAMTIFTSRRSCSLSAGVKINPL